MKCMRSTWKRLAAALRGRCRDDRGSVLMEFLLGFPLILALMLACMQFAQIWVARQVVVYAAYCAARAGLVCHDDEMQAAGQQAAEQVLAWVILGQAQGEAMKQLPGWGNIPDSGSVKRKVKAEVQKDGEWNVKAKVTFDYALVMPIAGPMIGWAVNPWQFGREWLEQKADITGNRHRMQDTVSYPHVRFEETVSLSKPYKTLPKMGIPSGGW